MNIAHVTWSDAAGKHTAHVTRLVVTNRTPVGIRFTCRVTCTLGICSLTKVPWNFQLSGNPQPCTGAKGPMCNWDTGFDPCPHHAPLPLTLPHRLPHAHPRKQACVHRRCLTSQPQLSISLHALRVTVVPSNPPPTNSIWCTPSPSLGRPTASPMLTPCSKKGKILYWWKPVLKSTACLAWTAVCSDCLR